MTMKIRIAKSVVNDLKAHHLAEGKSEESLSYLWAFATPIEDGLIVHVPHNAPRVLFAPDCFVNQSYGNVRLDPEVLNGMLVQFAASSYNCLINVHDHWFDKTTSFSSVDDRDDVVFDTYLREAFEPMLLEHPHIGPAREIFNVSMVLAQKGVDARLIDSRKQPQFVTASSVHVLGEHYETMTVGQPRKTPELSERFSRQRDFISPSQQSALAAMDVVIVGAGGLGSIVAENLSRVGVGGITLIDDDTLDESNLNRWQGGTPDDIGKFKAEILSDRLLHMCPEVRVTSICRSIYEPEVEQVLGGGDIIIGALDNDEARYFLNRVCIQYGNPLFDAGVAVTGTRDTTDFSTRYFALIPGVTTCMECTQLEIYDKQKVSQAFMDDQTLQSRRAAGYVLDEEDIASPSVYFLNQQAVSKLVAEFLNYVCGWKATATTITERWGDAFIQRGDRDNFAELPDPECPACNFYAGVGNSEELPRPSAYRPGRKLIIVPVDNACLIGECGRL